jgi:hypothetical protein
MYMHRESILADLLMVIARDFMEVLRCLRIVPNPNDRILEKHMA